MAKSQTATAAEAVATASVQTTDYHKSIINALQAGKKASETMQQKLEALIRSKYGDCMPTIVQYTADQSALKLLADQRGLADNQWVRKPYALAVRAVYGALPVSTGQDAEGKRLSRYAPAQKAAFFAKLDELQAVDTENKSMRPHHVYQALAHEHAQGVKTPKSQPTVGAPAGVVKDQEPSKQESISQFIARVGTHAVLAELIKILEADKTTKTQAATLAAIDRQLNPTKKAA